MYYYQMMDSGDWFFMFMLSIFGIIFLTALVFGIVRLSRSNQPADIQGNKSLDIVKERYAKGELTKDEFERLKKDLAD